MSSEVKKTKKEQMKQPKSMLELACLNAKVEEAGKIHEEMLEAKSFFEFDLYHAEMSIELKDNQIDAKTGDRYLNGVKISKKGSTVKPRENKKDDNDLTH